jgi:MULE transposase domain
MPASSQSTHFLFQQQCTSAKTWDCKLLFQEAYCLGDTSSVIDLCDKMMESNDYMFPECYFGEESTEKLVSDIKIAAMLEGYCLVIASSASKSTIQSKTKATHRIRTIRLECEHNRVHRLSSSTAAARNTSTKHPMIKEASCNFRLILYLVGDTHPYYPHRWFLKSGRTFFRTHQHHFKLDSEDLSRSFGTMSEEAKELARTCNQIHMAASHSAALLTARDALGLAWNRTQISYLTQQERKLQSRLNHNASSADQLISSFENRSDVSFAMIFYDRFNGLMLLRKNERKQLTVPSLEDATKLHLECGFEEHQKMLLIFLFASDEEFRQLMMHPEVLACDTTFGVEKSKKGLFTIAGVDGNKKAFNCGRAFIPNERTWVFQLMFHNLLPFFWGEVICGRIRTFVTDGCPQEYHSIIRATGAGNPFPKAVHSRCFFHLVVQPWRKMFPKTIQKGEHKTWLDQVYAAIEDWCYYCETEEEYNASRARMLSALFDMSKENPAKQFLVSTIQTFITRSLDPYLCLFVRYSKMSVPRMGQYTSNLCEVQHRSAKTGVHAVSVQMTAEASANAQMDKAQFIGKSKKKVNAQEFTRHRLFVEDDIGQELTRHAEAQYQEQRKLSEGYCCVAHSPTVFAVFLAAGKDKPQEQLHALRTRFIRLRMVIFKDNGYVSCTCGYAAEFKMPCRHILRVTGSRTREMYGLRWFVSFQHCYGRPGHDDATMTASSLMEEEHSRQTDTGEHILCNLKPKINANNYPYAMGENTGEEELLYGQLLYQYFLAKKPLIRGEAAPSPNTDSDDDETSGNITMSQDLKVSHSSAVTKLLSDTLATIKNTQTLQQNMTYSSNHGTKATYGATCLDACKDGIKLTEDCPNKRNEFYGMLVDAVNKFRPTPKDTANDNADSLYFPEMGSYRTKRVKRKGF